MNATNDTGLLNLRWAQALADGFAAAGLRHLVLSPGSRSTPLALAFLRHPTLRCHVILDERSAAFFALGLAKASRGNLHVALLCTSGSAPANWFPAVIEADQGATPLILLSADRPPEQIGWGANQTIDQHQLFGKHVRAFHAPGTPTENFSAQWLLHLAARAISDSTWPLAGPVHLNLPFREPLLPAAPPSEWPTSIATALKPINMAPPKHIPDADLIAATAAAMNGRPGVIVCGGGDYADGFAGAISALAKKLACPIFAEPLSNLRFGAHDRSHLCVRHESFLRVPALVTTNDVQWIMRFGDFPVTRSVQEWLAGSTQAHHVVVTANSRWPDPQYRADTLVQADPLAVCQALLAATSIPAPASWLRTFMKAESAVQRVADSYAKLENFEGALISTLLAQLPDGHRLFCGNSMAIRELDTFSGSGNKALRVFGNRGASGIDGNLSTAIGIATAAGATVALVGDLTAQHDLTALAATKGVDIIIIVMNNGGGGLFDYLPQAALPEFERAWLTPQTIDFSAAARAFSVAYTQAPTLAAFACALESALARGGPTLIEAVIDRQESFTQHRAYREAITCLRR